MSASNLLHSIILSILFISCGGNSEVKKKQFSIKIHNTAAKIKLGESLKASIQNKKNIKIDSIQYQLGDTTIQVSTGTSFEKVLKEERLGNRFLKATVFFEGTQEVLTKKVTLLNDKAPKLYHYTIIAEYPHDQEAYTQGLEFSNDTLIESTGRRGKSSLRKVALTTGEVLMKKDIDKSFFAEGITVIDGKIIQLTWQAKEGFIYDLHTLEKTASFGYNQSKEGWGLCNDGTKIYKSDGTEKIWILDPETLAELSYIEVTTNTGIKSKFNELEWIDGKIYANTWQKDGIAIINPKNGALEGVINLSGLREKVKQHENLDVLNGIAYKKDTKQIFVTGKNWNKLFEIKVVEK